MSEHLKFIVQELNKDPLNKNFNIISFDSLEPLQLLQIVNDVIAIIDAKNKIDIREESIEQTCIRIMELLQIFRYKPAVDQNNLNILMQGLVIGDKLTIYPILNWLLSHITDLKKRAYLSRFMVMIQVPTEFLQDEEVARLYDQYEEAIQTFKETHKELDMIKSAGITTSDVKKDINTMQNEKEQLIKRVERQRRKVESYPNSEPMLEIAKKLRTERDKESKLQHQIQEQKALLMTTEQKINRINQQVKEMRQIGATATPESLVQRQEEETRFNQLMVTEKLPKELAKNEKYLQDLQNVISEPAMSQNDLDKINKKIKDVNAEINRMTETRMMSMNTKEDKLIMFRQQASQVSHKKDNAVEQLRDIREALNRTESELEEKRNKVLTTAGKQGGTGNYEPVLRGEEFKKYVAQLRTKSNDYKPKRQLLSELKAEQGILARTAELLVQQDEKFKKELNEIESKRGASGYWNTQDNLEKVSEQMSDLNTRKGAALEDMSVMISKLTNIINSKKNNLIPMVKDVKPLRQKAQELQHNYDDKKQSYDNIMATFEVNRSKLDHEVKVLKEELKNLESRYHYITCMESMLKSNQTRLQEEMKIYLSQDPNEKKKSYREMYTKKINEQEALAKSLRERQKAIRESHGPNLKQRQMWSDLDLLMKCKFKCRQEHYKKESAGGIYSDVQQLEENRLIL